MLSLKADTHTDVEVPDFLSKEISTGTTIMAVEFEGGVVIGADSRTTMGAYIADRVADKLTKMENNQEPTVHAAANVFRDICYNYREQLMAGIICAGWDERNGGQVYCIPLGGMLAREPVAIGGSGSSYIYGYVDSSFKRNMTEDQCVEFVVRGLSLAMCRDGSSGGCARIGIIDKNGIRRKVFLGNELPQFD